MSYRKEIPMWVNVRGPEFGQLSFFMRENLPRKFIGDGIFIFTERPFWRLYVLVPLSRGRSEMFCYVCRLENLAYQVTDWVPGHRGISHNEVETDKRARAESAYLFTGQKPFCWLSTFHPSCYVGGRFLWMRWYLLTLDWSSAWS